MTAPNLTVHENTNSIPSVKTLVVIGRSNQLSKESTAEIAGLPASTWAAMCASLKGGDAGASTTSWDENGKKVIAAVLPEPCSRHNSPSRAWAIPALAKSAAGKGDAAIVMVMDDASHAFPSALAIARAFPLYSGKSKQDDPQEIHVAFIGPDGSVSEPRAQAAMEGVRMAARLVDTPCSELHTNAFVDEARGVAERTGSSLTVIQGEDLISHGLGGIWGVGKAATNLPALAVLEHNPAGAKKCVAWVGKGVVYDTGGLSIKTRGMAGMKGDMGGAGAVIAAFEAAVKLNFPHKLVALLCLAENAVGPEATRPDDIHTLFSGKTVEINNTDAEGRLVLADGVAWATKNHNPDLLLDMATLTGAVLISTGKAHAGIYTNSEAIEVAAIAAGKRAGEPVHPMLYAPELFRKEFKSNVADMKNSVKDRMNAQSSCAGQFIANHLPEENTPDWIHVDIAGTAWDSNNLGTGYGVGLLLELGAGE
jgi:probable aminopeptidase NPEPL1